MKHDHPVIQAIKEEIKTLDTTSNRSSRMKYDLKLLRKCTGELLCPVKVGDLFRYSYDGDVSGSVCKLENVVSMEFGAAGQVGVVATYSHLNKYGEAKALEEDNARSIHLQGTICIEDIRLFDPRNREKLGKAFAESNAEDCATALGWRVARLEKQIADDAEACESDDNIWNEVDTEIEDEIRILALAKRVARLEKERTQTEAKDERA